MSKNLTFIVEVNVADGVSNSEAKEYIKTAIDCFCKGSSPDDDIWDTETISIKVVS